MFIMIQTEMFHYTRKGLSEIFLLFVALHVQYSRVQGSSCGGIICENGGTVITDSEFCQCRCPSETTGLFCEYKIRESSFPEGPYAIPMSKDGCPEGRAQGWGTGYINITTKLSLYEPMSYPESCQEFVQDEQFILKPNNPAFKTNILGPFDQYTVQLNFCFKFSGHIKSANGTWPQGNYGVFGIDKECPAGLSSHVLTVYFPPLLHYNVDGHVPYLDVIKVKGGTELKFHYCRHLDGDAQDDFPLDSFNPFMMIKDPELSVYGCPKVNGYDVIDENFPGPMPTAIQGLNTTYPGNTYDHFPLTYCHAIPYQYNKNEQPGIYLMLFQDNGFPGSAFPFVEVTTEQYGCDNLTSESLHVACEDVPTWIMIDIRRAVLVSAIMISKVNSNSFRADISHIYVANERWGLLHDGALLCRHNVLSSRDTVHIFACYKPQHGRFVTLVRTSYTAVEDDWNYSRTFITILSYNSTEVNTMEKKYKNQSFFAATTRAMASVIKYTDIESKVCRQELGMQNFGIWDTQLTASSWQPSHQPKHARPQLSGWCADSNDAHPYLQVDLGHVTLVDGIVLINWYELIDSHDNNIYQKEVVMMGPLSFRISYGSDLRRLQRTREYTYDISRKLGEPQTFIFSDPVLAKYLQIYPNHFPSTNVTCIKFEILGCRISESISLDCENSSSKEITHAQSIFVPNNKRANIYANLTSLECEARCLFNGTNCISAHYKEDGSCLLYTGDETRNYITVAANDSRDVLSMVTCLIDQKKKAPPIKISSHWETYETIAFRGSLILTNVEYPFPYTYNSVYTWKIDFTEKYVILQFLEISLRSLTTSPRKFFNDIECQDLILIGDELIKPVWNPFDISNTEDALTTYYVINSDYTGRNPAYSMGRRGKGSFYISFISCSAGTSLDTGRGFRVHLSGTDQPFCLDNNRDTFCLFPEMELVSHRFLGRYDTSLAKGDFREAYSWTIYVGSVLDGTPYASDSLIMSFEFVAFDISCHSESMLEILNEFGKKRAYCNNNRPYGKQLVLTGLTLLTYKLYQLQSAVNTFFPEGFHLSYRCIPKQETLPYNLSKHTDDSMDIGGSITHVCADGIPKCYTIRNVMSYSWEDVANMCERSNSVMVNIKNFEEMSIIRSILIDHYRDKLRYNLASDLFIGLRRYIDSSGMQHEHWADGSPLTFTAWDDNEPSDILLNQCTKMGFHLPSDNTTWKTQPCKVRTDTKMTAICEQTISVTNNIPTEFSLDADNTNSTEVTVAAVRDPSTLYKCSSGEWISSLAKCNGVRECFDSSDEMHCKRPDDASCTEDEFTCPDGRCIHVSKVCDFVEDCVNAADEFCEFPSCTSEQYTCASGQCIWSNERCDSVKNCLDASDEMNCDECSLGKAFQCGDKSCISARLVCDMHIDCPDGADEMSCDHEYNTCDELWRAGYIKEGYFHIEQSYYIYCTYHTFRGGMIIEMRYLNTDWKQLESNKFRIQTAGIRNALDSGFACTQKFSNYPHRERLNVMEIDNKTFTITEKKYELNHPYDRSDDGDVFGVQKIFDGEKFSSFILTAYDDFNAFEDRIKIGSVECLRWITDPYNLWKPTLFCRHGVESVNKSQRCLYRKDKNDIIDGCRSLAHLQNCENFTCPRDYVKCPHSFCIPLMYVCNGRIDCPDGFDEKLCACENKQRKIIILTPLSSDGRKFHEVAASLGGLLFTENSSVKILKYEHVYIPENYLLIGKRSTKPTITLHSSNIMSNSEYNSKPYQSFNLNNHGIKQFFEDFFGDDTEHVTLGMIWLTDEHTETYTENIISSQLDSLEKNTSITVNKYRVVIDRNSKTELFHSIKHNVTEIYVRNANILGTIGTQLFPQLCKGQTLQCNGMYRCLYSKVCIPVSEVCDNQSQCPYGDDEDNCGFRCPKSCSCGPLIVDCSNIKHVNVTFSEVTKARVLDISNSTHICKDLLDQHHTRQSLTLLILLNMSSCDIKTLVRSSFDFLYNLKTLDLTLNKLKKLPTDVFKHLKVLKYLKLNGNHQLIEIESGAFNGISLNTLTISHTKVHTLSADTFKGLHLDYLDLTYNEISSVQDFTFNSLESNTIDLRGNPITQFTSKMFSGVINVNKLKTPAFKFCCIRPSTVLEEDCLPYKDEFSSCEDLMRNGTLQALMWIIGVLSLLGNVLSLVYRLAYDRKRLKLGFGIFVTNLAIADLFMGVYMLIIAVADKIFRDRYIEVDEYWRKSVWCQLAGVLSTASSEASVLFMCLITIDRILVIKYPFGRFRFNEKSATCASVATWVFVLIISILPVLYTQYFEGKFYGKSAVCLALPLTRDRPPGWLYSILLFIGFNMITFILIAVGQLLIYAEIKKQSSVKKSLNITRTNDLKVARNLLLIVTTDFLCWFPIGMMGSLALAGHTIPGEVYAWTAVIILPINSALNPFMYTLTAFYNRQKFSPSVDEQSRTDLNKEMGKAIMKMYPYVPTYKLKKNCTITSLRDLMESRRLMPLEIAHLAHHVVRFIMFLHDHDLVIRGITESDVFIALVDNGLAKRRILIDVHAYLDTSTKKTGHADNVYAFGRLLGNVLSRRAPLNDDQSSET